MQERLQSVQIEPQGGSLPPFELIGKRHAVGRRAAGAQVGGWSAQMGGQLRAERSSPETVEGADPCLHICLSVTCDPWRQHAALHQLGHLRPTGISILCHQTGTCAGWSVCHVTQHLGQPALAAPPLQLARPTACPPPISPSPSRAAQRLPPGSNLIMPLGRLI
jgi:hypothetical protein